MSPWTSRPDPADAKPAPVGSLRADEKLPPATRWALPYSAAYLGYLFLHRESEAEHWISLVLLPLLLVAGARWSRDRGVAARLPAWSRARATLRDTLASFGLRRGHLRDGLAAALIAGVLVGLLQVSLARAGDAFLEAVRSGRAIWLLPLAFVLLLLTAGFTEEFFFRGFLQNRLAALSRSRWIGWIAASLAFGAYHVPYAYYNPAWPSAGDWGAAWSTAMWEGTLGGLLLGGLWLWSRGNLVACVVLHAAIDAFPALAFIRFGGG